MQLVMLLETAKKLSHKNVIKIYFKDPEGFRDVGRNMTNKLASRIKWTQLTLYICQLRAVQEHL